MLAKPKWFIVHCTCVGFTVIYNNVFMNLTIREKSRELQEYLILHSLNDYGLFKNESVCFG